MGASLSGIVLAIWIAVFPVLTTVVIGLRLWAVYFTRKGVRLPDYLVITACVRPTTAMAAVSWCNIANGLGKHTKDISTPGIGVQWQLFKTFAVTWLIGTVVCKLSILTLYLSIFSVSRAFRALIYTICGIVGAYFVAFLTVFLTQCHTASYGWNPVPGKECKYVKCSEITSIALNIFLDTAIAVLPLPILWKLQITVRNKITIGAMFLMGLIIVAILIWRLRITLAPEMRADLAHGLAPIALSAFLELWLSMVIISLPKLAPLFRHYIEPCLPRKRPAGQQLPLRIAQHTIGSTPRKKTTDILQSSSTPDSTTELAPRGYQVDIECAEPGHRFNQASIDSVQAGQSGGIQIHRAISVWHGLR